MAAKHTCYFSKVDRNSQIVIEQLKDSSFFREFRYICVDPLPSTGKRPPLPPYVRSVPMLIIEGEKEPLVDAAIQNWISERKLRESGTSGVDKDWGLSGISGGDASPFGEIWNSTGKTPTVSSRIEGSMVSFTADDAQFGKMMASDAPISTGATGASPSPSPSPSAGGGRGPSAKLQELQARTDLMLKMRSELTGPMTTPTPPAWISQGGQGGGQQQYSQQQMMMAQQQQQQRQQQQQQQQLLLQRQQQQQQQQQLLRQQQMMRR